MAEVLDALAGSALTALQLREHGPIVIHDVGSAHLLMKAPDGTDFMLTITPGHSEELLQKVAALLAAGEFLLVGPEDAGEGGH